MNHKTRKLLLDLDVEGVEAVFLTRSVRVNDEEIDMALSSTHIVVFCNRGLQNLTRMDAHELMSESGTAENGTAWIDLDDLITGLNKSKNAKIQRLWKEFPLQRFLDEINIAVQDCIMEDYTEHIDALIVELRNKTKLLNSFTFDANNALLDYALPGETKARAGGATVSPGRGNEKKAAAKKTDFDDF